MSEAPRRGLTLLRRSPRAAPVRYSRWSSPEAPRTIIAVGDLQRTAFAERALARRQNNAAREMIVAALVDEHPDLLLLLGDQVSEGGSARDWAYFDRLMAPVREAGMPVHALPGNHDYARGIVRRGLAGFAARFGAECLDSPETLRLGHVVLVTLDSNLRRLGPAAALRQAERYRAVLEELDKDPTVAGVIVASHHPPYTNSSLRVDTAIIDRFARPFLDSRKGMIFLSGHVHSYERFEVEGKMFVVSGGGGGPRRAVSIADRRRHLSDRFTEGGIRPFHYLRIRVLDERLEFEAMMLQETPTRFWRPSLPGSFVPGDVFSIGLPDDGQSKS